MNFGQALDQMMQREVSIRRASWKPTVALGLDAEKKLVWIEVDDEGFKAELVSCLPAAEIVADDWEVVS